MYVISFIILGLGLLVIGFRFELFFVRVSLTAFYCAFVDIYLFVFVWMSVTM